MANLSQIKRQRMIEFLDRIRQEHGGEEDVIIAINEIENELTSKKYGLVWEEHEEQVDVQMRTKIPVFTEDREKEIIAAPGEKCNFLLEGDNLHSLRLLEKTHRGRIDMIYIDPPYNTENKDFIYDDTQVGVDDGFRHSKWLSFMNQRLSIASRLLSENGAIVISIGYHEVNQLMMLCSELFSNKNVVCVTVQTSGGKPNMGFTFLQEYLIYITPYGFSPNPMSFTGGIERSPFEGLTLSTFDQTTRPGQTYPIFVDNKTGHIRGVGHSLTERIALNEYSGELSAFVFDYEEAPEGCSAIWPVSSKGIPCVWRLIPERLINDWEMGYIKVSPNRSKGNKNKYSIQYLPSGLIEKIKDGRLEVLGTEEGTKTLKLGTNKTEGSGIPTIWTEKEFFTNKGSGETRVLFGDKRFSYPKPVALIKEILKGMPINNAYILDFFAGSGTTGQAVLELNSEDGGNRSFILCTNNENDICEKVTYERLKTVISGKRADGSSYSEGLPANLKYYRTDFVEKDNEDLQYDLMEHVAEMIQLEHGIDLENGEYVVLLDDDDADDLEFAWDEYEGLKGIYMSSDVLLTAEQSRLFSAVELNVIPDYYFDFELREAGELL